MVTAVFISHKQQPQNKVPLLRKLCSLVAWVQILPPYINSSVPLASQLTSQSLCLSFVKWPSCASPSVVGTSKSVATCLALWLS
jgi:hypothetical protein